MIFDKVKLRRTLEMTDDYHDGKFQEAVDACENHLSKMKAGEYHVFMWDLVPKWMIPVIPFEGTEKWVVIGPVAIEYGENVYDWNWIRSLDYMQIPTQIRLANGTIYIGYKR